MAFRAVVLLAVVLYEELYEPVAFRGIHLLTCSLAMLCRRGLRSHVGSGVYNRVDVVHLAALRQHAPEE